MNRLISVKSFFLLRRDPIVVVMFVVVDVVAVVVFVVAAAAAAMTTACNVERITAFKPFQIRVFQVMRKKRSITRYSATRFASVRPIFCWTGLA